MEDNRYEVKYVSLKISFCLDGLASNNYCIFSREPLLLSLHKTIPIFPALNNKIYVEDNRYDVKYVSLKISNMFH